MEKSKKIHLSKSLAWLLRHGAQQENVPLGSDGFIPVEAVLEHKSFKGKCTQEDIEKIVTSDLKNRYTLRINKITGKHDIRANQGHSIVVNDLDLTAVRRSEDLPNQWVVHGTYHAALTQIMQQGLSRMSRNHIHCSPYEPGDRRTTSGIRANVDTLIYIDVNRAIADGIKFFKSSNGVILSEGNSSGFIEPKYFLKVKDLKTAK